MIVKLYKYPSAVRYHYYHNYWQRVVGEELDCTHERDNSFDLFAIAIQKTTGEKVGHLQMENSRVTKYLMDRVARFTVILTSSKYYVSPLAQGGLEIPFEVEIYLPLTQKKPSLSECTITLSNRKFIPVLKALWLVHICKRQQKYPRHLPLTNPRKKTLEKKHWRKIGIRNFFSAKS